MKQVMTARQGELFEREDPPPVLPPERRAKLLPLVQALLVETMIVGMATPVEDGHEQDHT